MEQFIIDLNDISEKSINYDAVNKLLKDNNYKHRVRNIKERLQLSDVLEYMFNYSKINNTKDNVITNINYKNKKNIHRTSFYKKEKNIPYEFYNELKNNINILCNNNLNKDNKEKIAVFDGTTSNDIDQNVVLNMGCYDVTNNLIIDFTYKGKENRCKELKCCMDYIKNNKELFKNTIIVCDRLYYCYDFMNSLIDDDIKFVLRGRGDVKKLQQKHKNTLKNEKILKIQKNVNVITYKSKIKKTIFVGKTKSFKGVKKELEIENDCVIITNIKDITDESLMEIYKKRWDIEVFFKIIKNNFKIQHTKEKNIISIKKIYCLVEIIINLMSVFEHYYKTINKINDKTKIINKTILIDGIFKIIIPKLLNSNITMNDVKDLCMYFIKIQDSKENRHYERTSNRPFSKWYVKGYSNTNELNKMINKTKNLKNLKNLKNKKRVFSKITYNEIFKIDEVLRFKLILYYNTINNIFIE